VVVVLLLRSTPFGFRVRVLGAGPAAAEHAGMDVRRTVLGAMAVCGALGGLAGAVIVLGDRFRVLETVSEGYGFIAILAALLARTSPLGTVLAAIFFAALQRGGQVMEASGKAPEATVLIVQGLAVLLIAGAFEIERRRALRAERLRSL
jgi:simple sugar transport system permease protein